MLELSEKWSTPTLHSVCGGVIGWIVRSGGKWLRSESPWIIGGGVSYFVVGLLEILRGT